MPVEKVDCATRSHLNVCGHELSSVIISRKTNFLASLRFHIKCDHTKDDCR